MQREREGVEELVMIDGSPALPQEFADALAGESILASRPALLDLLPLGCYACDASGNLRWFNEKAAEFWGRRPRIGDDSERFCGSHKLYSLDGSVIRREQTPMAHVLRTGEAVSGGVATVERPDGTLLVAMVHIAAIKDAAGNVIGAVNCFHDITEVKESERRHRLSEEYFRDLLNALPTAIYTTDTQGRVTFYNEAAVALAGRRPQLGTDEWCVSWELYNSDGSPLPHDECPMAVAIKENRAVRGSEAVLKRPDGTFVPFLPYPTPLHDASGQLIGAVNVLVDISHRKEAEALQRVLFSELNHRVKNNLQMLQALLQSGVRETQSSEARKVLSDVAQRVSAISAAQKVLYQVNRASEFEAKAFIESVCACVRDVLPKGVSLECEAESFVVSNDTVIPLALILNELVTNAAKHGTDGQGRARILVRFARIENGCTLQVSDSGPGFAWETPGRRTSGLGLVQGLVSQIGGTLALEAGPGAQWILTLRQ